jgi:putative addiction module CopG family antidote
VTIVLDPDLEKFIAERLRSGRYASPEEVLRAGFASLEQQESITSILTSEIERIYPGFREKIVEGLADERAGRFSDGEVFFAELQRDL